MRRLNASDDRWLCIDTPENPMQIAGLLLFETTTQRGPDRFDTALRHHLARRLVGGPLAVRFRPSPFHFDTGMWLSVGAIDIDRHVRRVTVDRPLGRREVNEFVAREAVRGWDPDLPPFRIVVFDRIARDVADVPPSPGTGLVGMLLQTHHALADGMGFQAIVEDLTDESEAANTTVAGPPNVTDEHGPWAPFWLAQSAGRLALARWRWFASRADRREAAAQLDRLRASPGFRRARSPEVPGIPTTNSAERLYERLTVPLSGVRSIGSALGGTVNDAALTLVAGALRRLLDDRGVLAELADHPLVAMVPRSLRQPEHGRYGNHLSLMLPQLATNLPDPVERFSVIRATVRAEIERNDLQVRIAPLEDRPFAARRRRRVPESGTLAGNVSVSNVPGPSLPRFLAGYRQVANHPAPNLVAGQFLNITLRRYCDELQFGVMTDPNLIDDLQPLRGHMHAAYQELQSIAERS